MHQAFAPHGRRTHHHQLVFLDRPSDGAPGVALVREQRSRQRPIGRWPDVVLRSPRRPALVLRAHVLHARLQGDHHSARNGAGPDRAPALAATFGWLVLDEQLAPSALAGAGLVALAVVLIALREHVVRRSGRSTQSAVSSPDPAQTGRLFGMLAPRPIRRLLCILLASWGPGCPLRDGGRLLSGSAARRDRGLGGASFVVWPAPASDSTLTTRTILG